MKYRKEIDGLRAVAVIPVILFHAGFESFSGGFVGVDVFFVISGYLITTLLLQDLQKGRFSLADFYERRARRILPALFFVMACSTVMGWLWLMPGDSIRFANALIAVSTFWSNILFWRQSGYFDQAAELNPLLHTWSLAVEEQYYILFPLFLLLMWRLARRYMAISLGLLALCSFALAEWMTDVRSSAAFFMLPTRGWELLIGALLAYYMHIRSHEQLSPVFRQAGSLIGLLLIGLAVLTFDRNTPFPGVYALAPTLGAALLIWCAGTGNIAGSVLRHPLLVGIGMISYSAYLWHQPLLVFARHHSLLEPSQMTLTLLAALSLPLAWLTWKYIEQPFRNRQFMTRYKVFWSAGAGITFFVALGVFVILQDGILRPGDERLAAIEKSAIKPARHACRIDNSFAQKKLQACLQRYDGAVVYLLGDSHAPTLDPPLRRELARKGLGLISLTNTGCLPVPGILRPNNHRGHDCLAYNQAVWDYLASAPRTTIILAGRWTLGLEGSRFNNQEGGVESGNVFDSSVVDEKFNPIPDQNLSSHIERRIRQLAKRHNVIVVSQIPEAGWDVPWSMAKRLRAGLPQKEALSTSYDVFLARNQRTMELMRRLKDAIEIVDPSELVCNVDGNRRCINALHGRPLYFDDDHPSGKFAEIIASAILQHLPSTLLPTNVKVKHGAVP